MTDKPKDKRQGRQAKPRLRLVGGQDSEGEARQPPERKTARPQPRGPVLANGLTARQEAFAQGVAGGGSASASYRAAYDASKMADATVWARASGLLADGKVRARVDALLQEKARKGLHDRAKAAAWALERLQKEAESAETDGARVQAVALVMRHHGLLTDRIEAEHSDKRTAAELETALRDRLAALLDRAG